MAKDKHVTNAEKPVPTYAVVLPEHAGKARRGCAAPVEVAGAWVDAPDGPRGELAGASLGDDRALFAGDRDVLRFAPPLALGARYTVAVVGAPFRDANPRKAGIARWMVATYGGASKDAVRAATLPPAGDTQVGAIRAYAARSLGIGMRSLKDHTVLGFSPWERPGGSSGSCERACGPAA